jgi:hypothetical protein
VVAGESPAIRMTGAGNAIGSDTRGESRVSEGAMAGFAASNGGAIRVGGFGGTGSSTILSAGTGRPAGSVFGGGEAAGIFAVGLPDSTGEAVLAWKSAGMRSAAICATRARNGLGWATGGVIAGGCAAVGVLDSISGALFSGGRSGAGSSTNLGGGGGAAGAAFADSTRGRTRESIVSPAGTAGSSSVRTEVSVVAGECPPECPLVKPKSRYCCGAAASNGTRGTARSCSTMDKTRLVTAACP